VYARSKVESRPLALALMSIIASGCAAGISSNPHGRGAGEWSVALPAAQSYAQGLAYGRGGSSERSESYMDDSLFAESRAAKVVTEEKKKPVRKRRAEQSAPAAQPAAPLQQQPAAPKPHHTERTEVVDAQVAAPLVLADASDVSRYEARQSQSRAQQEFRGGDAIVIGASTLVVVLLVVLLLVLLL
jgi:cobalamin biosynthesis Mg chelatase CobN